MTSHYLSHRPQWVNLCSIIVPYLASCYIEPCYNNGTVQYFFSSMPRICMILSRGCTRLTSTNRWYFTSRPASQELSFMAHFQRTWTVRLHITPTLPPTTPTPHPIRPIWQHHSLKCTWKYCLRSGSHFTQRENEFESDLLSPSVDIVQCEISYHTGPRWRDPTKYVYVCWNPLTKLD